MKGDPARKQDLAISQRTIKIRANLSVKYNKPSKLKLRI